MIRRLNYTGRKKIPRSRITIRLLPAGDSLYAFSADFDLAKLGFPADARVYIEAYNSSSYMRFPFGTVAQRLDPRDLRLSEIARRPLPKFRLKVVDHGKRLGLLLGAADKIVPLRPDEDMANKQSLLPVDFVDLGDRVWRLELSDWPVLELNNRIETIGETARSGDAFLGLVFPEVLRQILEEIVIRQDETDPDLDESDWTSLWMRYVCSLPGVSDPPTAVTADSTDLRHDWIEDVVQAFCRSKQARQRFESEIQKALL
jgi:hypothetical protein